MIIIGAGLTGLIAGHFWRGAVIHERQLTLPNNHHALLRFKSDAVSKVVGIPFQKGIVRKSIICDGQFAYDPNPYLANSYSIKVTGAVSDRSIWDLTPGPRYVAPMDFVQRAAQNLNIKFGKERVGINNENNDFIVSTIPMPTLMAMSGWKHIPDFKVQPIWSIQIDIINPIVNVFQTIYYPSFEVPYYRASITGSRLIVEYISEPKQIRKDIKSILDDFGIPMVFNNINTNIIAKKHEYGKILPIDEDIRQDFIYTMTREHGIYSLGRFATWKQILLDDVVKDCEFIDRLMRAEGGRREYQRSKMRTGR